MTEIAVVQTENAGPSVTVLSPNGGEVIERGSTHTITWATTGDVGDTMKIILKRGAAKYILATTAPNTGSWDWVVAENLPEHTEYYMEIKSAANSKYIDISDELFEIVGTSGGGGGGGGGDPEVPSVTVVSPNGGEVIARGTTHTITWATTGNVGDTMKIILKRGGAKVVLTTTAPNTGSWDWEVSQSLPDDSNYYMEIKSAANSNYIDTSDGLFEIGP